MPVVRYCPKVPVRFTSGIHPYVYCPKEQRYYRLFTKTNKWCKMSPMITSPENVKPFFDSGAYKLLTEEQKKQFPPFTTEYIQP